VPVGRTAGEERTLEERAENFAPLHRRREHAEAVERVRDFLAFVAERDDGERRRGDRAPRAKRVREGHR